MNPEQRIAELEAENARLRAELDAIRREEARKARAAGYQARRATLKARGEWRPYADAGPVREHVRAVLSATGMSQARFASVSGLDEGTLCRLLRDATVRVKAEAAAKALKVTAGPPATVDATGSSRRLQALAYRGWSVGLLGERLGMTAGQVRAIRDGDRERIPAATAGKITALLDELWNTDPPEQSKEQRIAAAKTRACARKHDWVSAGAWDEDAIDDPSASPVEGWQRRRRLSVAELAEEARDLLAMGADLEEAAARLGRAQRTIERALAACPEDGCAGEDTAPDLDERLGRELAAAREKAA